MKFAVRELTRTNLNDSLLEVAMFRSMMLVCALGALGAVGCVGTSDAADDSATAQDVSSHGGGGGGLFSCDGSVSVVCTGNISILNGLTVNVDKTLDGNQLNVLSGDLNNLKLTDINILDGNKILDDVYAAVLNDFLNKFSIPVTAKDIDVCALIGILQICKNG